jgi:NAD-dependent dihydropyrimidine dehydrogenase PreA subunit
LIRVGNPGRQAPVLLTGNYDLTVRRVLRGLRGQDAYLLVAPSGGTNVWCASAGGGLTAHQVISSLRTSGIDKLINHRRLILPQLCATGVEPRIVTQRTGWHVVFGPVYARDLPAYLSQGHKSDAMRQVAFPLSARLEMAVAWAFPISAVGGTVLAIGWPRLFLPFVLLTWMLSLALYTFFPWLYRRAEGEPPAAPGWTRYLVFFDPAVKRNLLLWVLFVFGLSAYALLADAWSPKSLVGWSLASLFIILVLSMDLTGSTPLYKSGLHEDKLLHIELNGDACRGRAWCREVCPKNCYEIDAHRHQAVIARPDACVQCGACVVQCPEDALAFHTLAGEHIPPHVIRTYKLNLLGRRTSTIA